MNTGTGSSRSTSHTKVLVNPSSVSPLPPSPPAFLRLKISNVARLVAGRQTCYTMPSFNNMHELKVFMLKMEIDGHR